MGGVVAGEGAWSLVPDDLVSERIASKLNAFDVLRLACTCRRFRSLFFSALLLRCSSSSSPSPTPNLLLLAADDPLLPSEDPHRLSSARSYDPDSHKWFNLSLSFLRPHLPPFSHPIASSRGLLCFGSGRSFVICNPLTKSLKKLPDIPLAVPSRSSDVGDEPFLDENSVYAFGLYCDPQLRTYEFVSIICNSGFCIRCKAMVYSSSLGRWMGISELNMTMPTELHSASIVFCDSAFYSLWQRPSEFVIYRLDGLGKWDEIEAPDCRSPLLSAHLMSHRGSLHLVAGVGMVWLHVNLVEYPMSIRIWKLDHQSKNWSEVTRLPSALLHEFHDRVHFHTLRCWALEGIIYMTSEHKDILMYDLNLGNWEWLEDVDMDGDLTGHILEPSLMSTDTTLSC